ncbi:hypothetical protein [Bdellovibrio sp. HCB-162]|uniref:hypothetical protein n=1 Tax=Bdellovibrio sp. HCB-162 TaxID=3394234 RepID=UPI0039BCFCF8
MAAGNFGTSLAIVCRLMFSLSFLLIPQVAFSSNTSEACVDECSRKHQNSEAMFWKCSESCYVPLPPERPADLGLPTSNVPIPTPRPSNLGQTNNRNSGGNNSSGGGGGQCQSQYDSLKARCEREIENTSSTCDEKNDSGLNSVSGTASQLALAMGQQTSSSVQSACSGMGDVSQAANAALAAYRLNCSNALSDCRKSCNELVDYAKNNESCLGGSTPKTVAEDKVRSCNNYVAKVNEANQAIQNYGATGANAAQCENQTKGDTNAADPSIMEVCKTNPTNPICPGAAALAQDCANPQFAATNKVCVCISNPNDPSCRGEQKAGGETAVASQIDSSSRLNTGGGSDIGGDLPGLPGIQQGPRPSGGSGEDVDGKQGNGVNFESAGSTGGGGFKSASSAGAGGDAATDSPAAPAGGGGFYGGGAARNGGSYGSDDGGGYAGAMPVAGKKGTANPTGPDLRQFLPGGKLDPRLRGIAGADGIDGITGPHSNIWQKIQNRYRVISPSLLVP